MGELGFNKIAGAVLATALVIFGLGDLSSILFKYQPPAKMGYAITPAVEGGAGAAAAVELPIDWGTELPKADVAAAEIRAETGATAMAGSADVRDPAGIAALFAAAAAEQARGEGRGGAFEAEGDVAEHRHMREDRIALKHDAAIGPAFRLELLAIEQDRAARGRFLAENEAQEARLARA